MHMVLITHWFNKWKKCVLQKFIECLHVKRHKYKSEWKGKTEPKLLLRIKILMNFHKPANAMLDADKQRKIFCVYTFNEKNVVFKTNLSILGEELGVWAKIAVDSY